MTLDEFRATKREVADLRSVIPDTFGPPTPGWTYSFDGGTYYIERSDAEHIHLLIANTEMSDHISALPLFEQELYEYARKEAL